MRAPTLRLLSRLSLSLALAVPACIAPPDEPAEEAGNNVHDEEALTGSLPVGTTLRTTGSLNLRSGPSTSNAVLGVIPKAGTVTLVESAPRGGFYHVSWNGTEGWCSGQYLEPAGGGTTGPATTTATLTTTADVNLRSGPSTSNGILAVIPLGSAVTVIAPDPVNGFYNVRYQGTDGWSSGKYLASGGAESSFAGGKLWKFRAQKLAVDIAVFVPAAAAEAGEVDVLFYAHGLNVCSPVAKNPPLDFVTSAPFQLASIIDGSKRPVVLAAPFFDWEHLAANGMAFNGSNHKLGIPANLNAVVAEVLSQVGQHRGAGAPALGSLILAGHSRAYSFLNPLAAASADPQMSTGALAQLAAVYGLDTGYTCSIPSWKAWMTAKPSLEVTMVYRAGTDTASCGNQFAAAAPALGGRLTVIAAKESHCAVPATELPGLLAELP